MPNRLADSSSPYLRQHAGNPVDWYPWGQEAFARAAEEDKPVFLSIGYSSCHWCHVMAHESFEDPAVAEVLNAGFVAIKVDREERPDVDEAYMTAVQLTSGRGGWPMSIFLTPDRRPFLAATYIPKMSRGEQPGFVQVCDQITHAWKTRREEVERVANEIANAIRQTHEQPAPRSSLALDQAFLDQAVGAMLADYDPDHGGFGPAPKFPPHTPIDFLMAYAVETEGADELREAAATAALMTLRQMCLGGIHDHVGGGFHRYSTDERWLLPHFEKMLTDNALMLSNLARARMVAEPVAPNLAELFRTSAEAIIFWLRREMTSSDGLFFNALDADSEGEEGKYYVWEESEVREVLGERAEPFLQAYGFQPDGNFYDEATGRLVGTNIPHLTEEVTGRFEAEREKLLAARARRVPPQTDEKAVVAANGMMIASLAENGMLEMAGQAADAILDAEQTLGRLPHQIVAGRPEGDAFLDGYAYFADSLLRLADIAEAFAAENEPVDLRRTPAEYREHAARLGGEMIARFYDDAHGGFFFASERHQELFGRSKPVLDQPIPSANAIGLRVLVELGAVPRIFQTRDALLGLMERVPQATAALYETMLTLLDETVAPPAALSEAPVEPATAVHLSAVVAVTVTRRELRAEDGVGETEVRISIPEGFHLNSSEPPARWLTPTKVDVRPERAAIAYPQPVDDRYVGDIVIPVRVTLPAGKSGAEFELRVSYQACTESECLLPEEKVFDCVITR